jgi:hypothetical protein
MTEATESLIGKLKAAALTIDNDGRTKKEDVIPLDVALAIISEHEAAQDASHPKWSMDNHWCIRGPTFFFSIRQVDYIGKNEATQVILF